LGLNACKMAENEALGRECASFCAEASLAKQPEVA
jgi:hypothetical protein